MRLALVDNAYDVAIVCTYDTDLLPAIETVMEVGCAHVEVAAWRSKVSRNRLRVEGTERPWCHWLDEVSYRSVADLTDYRKRR